MPRERKGSLKNKNNNTGNDVNDNEIITKTTNKKRRTSNANNNNNNNNNTQNNVNNSNNSLNNNNQNNVKASELIPPQPISTFGDTIIASNPFDDTPQQSSQAVSQSTAQSQQSTPQSTTHSPNNNMIVNNTSNPSMGPQSQSLQQSGQQIGPQSQPKPVPLMSGKIYPSDQSMVFNPANPNAPPIYPCGVCHKEVHDNDQAILCESGCNFWFHRVCTGITERAYFLLTQEIYAEWVCDNCTKTKSIPLVKFKP